MKNILKTMLALMAGTLALSACSDEDALQNNMPNRYVDATPVLSFTAATESDGATRAAIDGLDVKWQAGDAILMMDGTNSSKYNLASGAGTTIATFNVNEGATAVAGNSYALYPYAADATLGSGKIQNVTLPAVQTVAAGQTVDPKAVLMVAKADADHNLAFKNVVSYIKVTLNEACKKIEVRAHKGENLAGKVTVSPADASVSEVTGGSPVVTLQGDLKANTTYYIAVLPGTLAKGLDVKCFTGNDTFKYNTRSASLTLARNKVNDGGDDNGATGAYWTIYADRGTSWTDNHATSVTQVFINTSVTDKPSGAKSLNNDNTLWVRNDEDKYYIETSENRIFAQGMFSPFMSLTKVKEYAGLGDIDVSEVTSFYFCFSGNRIVKKLDLSSWQINPNANTNNLFYDCWELESLTLNNTFHAGWDMFTEVGRYLSSDAKCIVYGVTDNDVKADLRGEKDVNTKWKDENTKIMFYGDEVRWTKNTQSYGWCKENYASVTKVEILTGVNESTKPNDAKILDDNGNLWAYDDGNTAYICTTGNTIILASGNGTFSQMKKVEEINGLDKLITNEATHMGGMFYQCSALQKLDLSSFHTENVTSMVSMFLQCSSLTSLILSDNFKCPSGNYSMSQMLYGCGTDNTTPCIIYGVSDPAIKNALQQTDTYWNSANVQFDE